MFVNYARFTVAAVLTAGAVAALPGSAAAAPGRGSCLMGNWTLTKYVMTMKGKDVSLHTTGGQGTRLRVGKNGAVYDFNRSKPAITKGTRSGEEVGLWSSYRGRLSLKSKFRGARSGVLTTRPGSARGDANGLLGQLKPEKKLLAKYSIVETYRRGEWVALIPHRADFRCNGRTLLLQAKKRDFFGTSTVKIEYRRA
ncbi:hypothetical protein [Actinocorallia populi]|uniref:hypothetical protein n=1 Tax=Actinocorallia populi TaxID=2079200 RepID=UPI000D087E37|nr:hypothetical protein [Actinocorallia populi]